MQGELDILKEVCSKLDNGNIAYMLTGSFAANFYAVPRMTRDIDIVIEIQMKDADKVFRIFKSDFYVDKTSINEAIEHLNMFNIIHNELALKIDFIIRKNNEYRQLESREKKEFNLMIHQFGLYHRKILSFPSYIGQKIAFLRCKLKT